MKRRVIKQGPSTLVVSLPISWVKSLSVQKGDELDVLVTLVEVYERDHFTIESPDPVEAILFRMEQMGLDRKALEPFLGSRSRVSEVLNKKRSLSMSQIRKLHDGLKIPLENLIGTV